MQIFIVTPFPEFLNTYLNSSILGRAQKKKIVQYNILDLKHFGIGKHNQIDDQPFGGGPGMIMLAEPFFNALDKIKNIYQGSNKMKIVLPSPKGKILNQSTSKKLSSFDGLVFFCVHYKGVDERVIDKLVDYEISIGDYVVTGGELPSLIIIDSIVRLIPGVIGDQDSANFDSFSHDLLDHPHYSRPRNYKGMKVPDVLTSGNHAHIESWREKQREIITKNNRPDIWNNYKNKLSKWGKKYGTTTWVFKRFRKK